MSRLIDKNIYELFIFSFCFVFINGVYSQKEIDTAHFYFNTKTSKNNIPESLKNDETQFSYKYGFYFSSNNKPYDGKIVLHGEISKTVGVVKNGYLEGKYFDSTRYGIDFKIKQCNFNNQYHGIHVDTYYLNKYLTKYRTIVTSWKDSIYDWKFDVNKDKVLITKSIYGEKYSKVKTDLKDAQQKYLLNICDTFTNEQIINWVNKSIAVRQNKTSYYDYIGILQPTFPEWQLDNIAPVTDSFKENNIFYSENYVQSTGESVFYFIQFLKNGEFFLSDEYRIKPNLENIDNLMRNGFQGHYVISNDKVVIELYSPFNNENYCIASFQFVEGEGLKVVDVPSSQCIEFPTNMTFRSLEPNPNPN